MAEDEISIVGDMDFDCLICGFEWGVPSRTNSDPCTTIGFLRAQTKAMWLSPILVTSRFSVVRAIPNDSKHGGGRSPAVG